MIKLSGRSIRRRGGRRIRKIGRRSRRVRVGVCSGRIRIKIGLEEGLGAGAFPGAGAALAFEGEETVLEADMRRERGGMFGGNGPAKSGGQMMEMRRFFLGSTSRGGGGEG